MKRVRNRMAAVLLAALTLLPLPGCAGAGANPIIPIANLALSVGASVGSYLLIKELSK